MKIQFITLVFLLFSCENDADKKTKSQHDSLVESANLKIKLLQQRGDSIEAANVTRSPAN